MKKYTRYQQKIFMITLLPLLMIFIIGAGTYFTVKKNAAIKQNLNVNNDIRRVFSDLDLLKNNILLSICNENVQTEEAENRLQQKIGTVRNNFIIITDKITSAGLLKKDDVINVYDSLSVRFENVVQNIQQLSSLVRIRGTFSAGLIPEMMDAGRELSESVESAGLVNLSNIMHDVLIAQSSFIKNPGNSSFAELQTEVNSLKDALYSQETSFPDIIEKTGKYIGAAGALITITQKIGAEGNSDGLLYEYNLNRNTVSGLINRLDTRLSEILLIKRRIITLLFLSFSIIIFFVTAVFYLRLMRKQIYNPLDAVRSFVKILVTGSFPEKSIQIKTNDEIELLGNQLNKITDSLNEKTRFLESLNEGNIDTKLNLLGTTDNLGNALLDIQVTMKKSVADQKKHDEENARRRFINEGLAKFSEITHARYESIENLTDLFIKELVKYLDSLQGGVFLIRENEGITDLYLASAFAYDRKKFLSKTVIMGEGLVGTCAVEKRMILVTEIPADYISITSGLGDAPPNMILLMPMLQDNNLAGVIEIATLNTFKEHQLEFLKQVANNLANTLASTRINEKTSKLLHESQLYAQTMSEQEEEMRQNMEELKATQEESVRREEEFKGIADALGNSVFVAEFDLKGHLISMNEKFLVFLGKKLEQIYGKNFDVIIGNEKKPVFGEKALEEVLGGKQLVIKQKIKIGKRKEYTVQFHFAPELNRNDFPFKILCLGIELMS